MALSVSVFKKATNAALSSADRLSKRGCPPGKMAATNTARTFDFFVSMPGCFVALGLKVRYWV